MLIWSLHSLLLILATSPNLGKNVRLYSDITMSEKNVTVMVTFENQPFFMFYQNFGMPGSLGTGGTDKRDGLRMNRFTNYWFLDVAVIFNNLLTDDVVEA